MENIFNSLEAACRESGTNLTKVCRKAEVQRSTVQRWKQKEPNTIRIYRRLLAAIEASKFERQQTTDDDAC